MGVIGTTLIGVSVLAIIACAIAMFVGMGWIAYCMMLSLKYHFGDSIYTTKKKRCQETGTAIWIVVIFVILAWIVGTVANGMM